MRVISGVKGMKFKNVLLIISIISILILTFQLLNYPYVPKEGYIKTIEPYYKDEYFINGYFVTVITKTPIQSREVSLVYYDSNCLTVLDGKVVSENNMNHNLYAYRVLVKSVSTINTMDSYWNNFYKYFMHPSLMMHSYVTVEDNTISTSQTVEYTTLLVVSII